MTKKTNKNADFKILGRVYKHEIYPNEFGEKNVLKWSNFSPDQLFPKTQPVVGHLNKIGFNAP
jgi:hypothetical protein